MKNSLLLKALNNNFIQDYERRMSFQKVRLFDYAIQFDFPSLLDVDMGLQLYRIKNGIITHWFGKDVVARLQDKLCAFFKDSNSTEKINELIHYIEKSLIKLNQFSLLIPEYSTASDNFLLSEYVNFCKLERELSFMNQLLFLYVETALTKAIKSLLNDEELSKLEDLSVQTEPIPLDVYYLDICQYLTDQMTKEEIYNKYAHFGMFDVIDKRLSMEKLESDINSIKQKNPLLINKAIVEKYQQNEVKIKSVFSKIQKESHVYLLMKYFNIYSNKKEWKNFIRERSSYKLSKLLSEIAERRLVTLQELSYLREEEICKIITREINFENIKRRKENSLYIIHRDQIEVIEDKKLLEKVDSNLLNNEFELKGEIACHGKISGKVCIILSNQDFHKFDEGDIIVAPTIRPDYAPLMGKSSAIITNEGGMLSHVAILSREFEKPCITGTRIATTVLKDGDFIEVDAYKGTIKLVDKE